MSRISLFIICVAVISCSKKTVPAKTIETNPRVVEANPRIIESNIDTVKAHTDTVASSPVVTTSAFLVVSDGYGKIITSRKNLPPDANVKFDYLQLSKGFTPQQQANLRARYKTIPPRVLYITPSYQSNSARGAYYIYKKFWYWNKYDVLFYLDTKYYL
jgi:hypothetical protein